MDDKWFKHRQKIANVTAEDIADALGRDRSVVSRIYTGRQPMKIDEAKAFSKVLNVSLSEVMERAGIMEHDEALSFAPGFSEGDAVLLQGSPTERRTTDTTAQSLGGDRPGVDVWQVKSDALILGGLLPGDYILVDTHKAADCRPGDTVLAQIYNGRTGNANTLLRHYQPPVLVAASLNPDDQKVHIVDGSNVAIVGKIVASWRAR